MIIHPSSIDPTDRASVVRRLRTVPRRPGVYLMKDESGKVIYVGKAKVLRNRLRSYFSGGDGRLSIPFLVARVRSIETIVTEDEQQALVLEADLIKKHRPRYNVRLKDDRAYLMVRIDMSHDWPKLDLVRQAENDGAKYIGPFAYAYELRGLLEVIRGALPLRTCSDRVIYNRVRPCLEYQIKRCAGPCCLPVDSALYHQWIKEAVDILEGRNRDVLKTLSDQMERASSELRFEDAAELRDRMESLKTIIQEKPVLSFSPGAKDAFGIFRSEGNVELSILIVRRGRLFGARSFGFSDVEIPTEELLASVMMQFYADNEIPDEVLVPCELEDSTARSELLATRKGSAVEISVPKRGSRVRLLRLAEANATENFEGRFGEGRREDPGIRALCDELGLEQLPRTIECFDISHFQGGSTVGSVVFFQDGQPEKSRYRHYSLSQEGKPDDFASMREIVMRHLSRCAEENTIPDLIVIDGGIAQLNQALAVRAELGLKLPPMIGLAKKRTAQLPYYALGPVRALGARSAKPERVFLEGAERPIVLREGTPSLHLLERIRDEAHRFAITFHRSARNKRTFRSALDNIPGIGNQRKMALLRAYGGVRGVLAASPEDVAERAGIPLSLAKRVIDLLHRKRESAAQVSLDDDPTAEE